MQSVQDIKNRERSISVVLPENLTDADRHLFEGKNVYQNSPLKVLDLNNVVVTPSGIVFKNDKIIKEAIHGYKGKFKDFYTQGVYELMYSNQVYNLNDDNYYLLIHNPWFNYYHWITESLPRLWLVRKQLDELILILPEYYKKIVCIQESLEPFSFKEILYVPKKAIVKIKNAIIPQLKPICSKYYPEITNEIRDFYLDFVVNEKKSEKYLGEKIYISRAQSRRRKVKNEIDVQQVLEKFNIRVIYAENYSFFDQVAIFSKVRCLLSIHGAGLTNMQFMREGSSVLELHKKITNKEDHHSLVYWNLASSLRIKYFQQLCDPVDRNASFFTADYNIDLRLFEYNVKKMLDFRR